MLLGVLGAAAGSVALLRPRAPAPDGHEIRSLAVLPFKPLSIDDRDEYLGLGMADTLITKLSNVQQLIVRPTSAVLKYGSLQQDPVAAGREQQVDAVLEGSVQRAGEKIRVTVRLLDVRDGRPLWAYQCDEQQCTDLFAVQDAISQQVAQALTLRLSSAEIEGLSKRFTGNTEAYQAYVKGRYFWNKRTPAGYEKAIECYQQAIAQVPNYALAYTGLADAWRFLAGRNSRPKPQREEMTDRGKAAAMKAMELDDTLAETHVSLGRVRSDIDWAESEREFKRAIELNPNLSEAHTALAERLTEMGRHEEALVVAKRAQALDPVSLWTNKAVGDVHYRSRQYDQAIVEYSKMLELNPHEGEGHTLLGECYMWQGRYEEAIVEFNKATPLFRGGDENRRFEKADLGYVYALSGRRAEAMKVLDELKEHAKKESVSRLVANLYAALGEREQAFEWLEKAYRKREPGLRRSIKTNRLWDPFRSDPRFVDLLRRMGLPADRPGPLP
ncbi:MAG: tetratricopeptide repeat protein [Acidobacteria bacterium]|nr:tetratricopeptide repeat protein [Acidobacteriota bacterium]